MIQDLIVSRSDTISGKSHEFRPTQKVISLKRETPSIKHFLQIFREYKNEKRQTNPPLAKPAKRPVSDKEAYNKKSKSDIFLENYQKQEKIRLEKLAKSKANGTYIKQIDISPDSLIDSKQNVKKSNWKNFESQLNR